MQPCDRLYDTEIRKVICSANAIESLNARSGRAVRARGHWPNERAALRCLYPVTRSLDPTGTGRTRWAMRWKPAINALRHRLRRPVPGRRDLLSIHRKRRQRDRPAARRTSDQVHQ